MPIEHGADLYLRLICAKGIGEIHSETCENFVGYRRTGILAVLTARM